MFKKTKKKDQQARENVEKMKRDRDRSKGHTMHPDTRANLDALDRGNGKGKPSRFF